MVCIPAHESLEDAAVRQSHSSTNFSVDWIERLFEFGTTAVAYSNTTPANVDIIGKVSVLTLIYRTLTQSLHFSKYCFKFKIINNTSFGGIHTPEYCYRGGHLNSHVHLIFAK